MRPPGKEELDDCRRCELWRRATQGVPGQGPVQSALVLVGEQPGDEEDILGAPFVGPAGQLLDQALLEAGVTREQVFVTNAVKHFKWEPRGKRRLHKKPNAREVMACRYWLGREIAGVRPRVISGSRHDSAVRAHRQSADTRSCPGKSIAAPFRRARRRHFPSFCRASIEGRRPKENVSNAGSRSAPGSAAGGGIGREGGQRRGQRRGVRGRVVGVRFASSSRFRRTTEGDHA